MIALGSNVHIFGRPRRRQELAWCFEIVLGCGPVTTVEHPGMEQPMLLVRFPGGGHLSIEFTDDAPDDDQPRLGAWLELRADDPAAVLRAALDAGLTRVQHSGHPHYFAETGGNSQPGCRSRFGRRAVTSWATSWRRLERTAHRAARADGSQSKVIRCRSAVARRGGRRGNSRSTATKGDRGYVRV